MTGHISSIKTQEVTQKLIKAPITVFMDFFTCFPWKVVQLSHFITTACFCFCFCRLKYYRKQIWMIFQIKCGFFLFIYIFVGFLSCSSFLSPSGSYGFFSNNRVKRRPSSHFELDLTDCKLKHSTSLSSLGNTRVTESITIIVLLCYCHETQHYFHVITMSTNFKWVFW